MDNQQFKQMLEENPKLKHDVFIRGFMVTTNDALDLNEFPFYGNWREQRIGAFRFCAHELAGMHIYMQDESHAFFILGHAYDPFTMEHEETPILEHLAKAYGTEEYQDIIDGITGAFIVGSLVDGVLEYQVDPSGMQSACNGIVNGSFYLSSHPQIIGDVESLQMDAFVQELIAYKWYDRVKGPYLPADLTPFAEVKRIVPSLNYLFDGKAIAHKRFWPLKSHAMATDPDEYQQLIKQAADILQNGMTLISRKWEHPWISLTGGIDSNTTFAAANGNYDKFETFSYISAEKEIRDAAAASVISEAFEVPHHEFVIPEESGELEAYADIVEVLRHNNGYIAETPANEARKRQYLRQNVECDVEVKSWVSETIRAYWYKHYGRKSFPELSGKLYRNLYKIWISDRRLAHKVDKLFDRYIEEYEYAKVPGCYPPADLHYNEVTWGSWGGLNISEMKYITDITFVYNNRKFLDLLFRVPLSKRISDQHHLDMKRYLNPKLADMNIRVVNMAETDTRARLLNLVFVMNEVLP